MSENLKFKRIATYIIVTVLLFVGYYWLRDVPWQGSKQLHTLMEVIATLLALFVGVMALVRFYTKKDNEFLFIGTGFLGTSFLDGYHAIVTSAFFDYLFPSPPPSLIPWSWVASRVFLSILLWLSFLAWQREDKLGQAGRISDKTVYISVILLTFTSFTFFAFLPLPQAYYPTWFFHRPEELVPALFFFMALIGYLKKGHWQHNEFEHWLVLSLIVNFMGQMMFMSFSGHLFDNLFDIAHLLKKFSYLCVLIGLLINTYLLFTRLEKITKQLAIVSEETQAQSEELMAANEELQVQSEELRTQTEALEAELAHRQQLQEQLKQSEERFSLAMKGASDGLWDWDLLKNEVYLSPRWKELLGYEDSELNNSFNTFEALTHPHDLKEVIQEITNYLEQKTDHYEHSIRMQHKAGHWIWILTRGIAIRDEQNNSIRFIGTHVDITKQKQAELALQHKQARLEESQAVAHLGNWEWDINTNELFWSDEIYRIFGEEPRSFAPDYSRFLNFIHPDDRQYVQDAVADALQDKPYAIDHRIVLASGEIRYVHEQGKVYLDSKGQPQKMLGIVHDISERKQMEQSLRLAQFIIENAPEAIEWITPEGKLSYVNQAECDNLGYTREELLTMSIPDLDPNFPQENWEQAWDMIKQHKLSVIESTHQRKDGSSFPVEVTAWYLTFDNKEYLCSFVRNITERKANEQVLIQAKEKADAANHAKSVFLGNMSHELRTPLNAILGYTQILKQDTTLTEKLQQDIHVIHQNGQYLLTLINDILDLSKLESQHLALSPTEIRLSQFIQNVTELFAERAKYKGIAFNLEPLSQLPVGIRADERRLRQILVNLLGNAVKFTHEGGVTLKIDYRQDNLLFWIEDTGIGISKENLDKIFEPFHQVGDHFTAKAEGTGLGLSITQKLIGMMQGELKIESQLGQGSVFHAVLPLPEIELLQVTEEDVLPVITGFEGKPRTILVVDDKKENRAVLMSLLVPLNFNIIEAENGHKGLIQLEKTSPDLVITDLVMPVMDGFSFTRTIRKSEKHSKIPIIAVSASIFDHEQVAEKAGCNTMMTKPFHFKELLEAIGQLLNLRWVYSTTDVPIKSTSQTTLITDSPSESFHWHLVPADHLTILHDLSMKGDIYALAEEANILEKMDVHLQPLAEKIRSLANSFDTDTICELIEPQLPTLK